MTTDLITAPTVEPVTLAEVRDHTRVTASGDDAGLLALIVAARLSCEAFIGRALVSQVHALKLRAFPAGTIRIPMPPLISLDSVNYLDTAGVSTLWAASLYQVSGAHPTPPVTPFATAALLTPVEGGTYPSTQAGTFDTVTIQFTAGYGIAGSDVPEPLRQGMMMLVAHLYDNRGVIDIGNIVNELPISMEWLWMPYKASWFGGSA